MSDLGSMRELAVWSAMGGVIAVMCLLSIGDLMVQRSAAAARSTAVLYLLGAAVVSLSGLLEVLFPSVEKSTWIAFKLIIGPLSGAVALGFLGLWLGEIRDDSLTRWCVLFGGVLLIGIAATLVMTMGTASPTPLLELAAAVCIGMVVLGLFVGIRGALLGDSLAWWMVVATVCMGVATTGLYANALGYSWLGIWGKLLTALASVGYFLISIPLIYQRNSEIQRLRRVAQGIPEQNLNIPMPQGSRIVPLVADAIWRSQRFDRPCVVAAIVVRNLYDLDDGVDPEVEAQILAVLAARIRRHVGFRNVVGLYHQRCFVLAVSPRQDPRRGELSTDSLLWSLKGRVTVGPMDHRFDFWPSVGMGVVPVAKLEKNAKHTTADTLKAIHRAEKLALEDLESVIDKKQGGL